MVDIAARVVTPAGVRRSYGASNFWRRARTLAGVDARGRLLLAAADGIPGVSDGLTLTEEADLMCSLGAANAMNLDAPLPGPDLPRDDTS